MRQSLLSAMTGQFKGEIEASEGRIRPAITPYTRFVQSKSDRLTAGRDELARHLTILENLRSRLS